MHPVVHIECMVYKLHTSVVQFGYGPESFLAGRIPNLQTHSGGGVDIDDLFGHKRGAYSGLGRGRREGIFDITVHQRCLAHALAPKHHDLGLKAVGHGP